MRISFLSDIIWALYIAVFIIGVVKASNEEKPELPVIGDIAKSIFKKQLGV